ncbi:MAG: bifunctional tetrahydrofolate synthase/dihydrofolate synthase [Buchnera aphidicola (Melaphis rhois)]
MKNNIIKQFSFYEWLNYIEKFRINIEHRKHNVICIARKLGILPLNAFIYIVGGTNGKGTTCFVLEKILLGLGYRVGLYTSPHLFQYTERLRINGRELNKNLHVLSFIRIEQARDTLSLTYYEFITLSALYLLRYSELDVIILEVGLGGRLDATNIINPNISIITNIGLDHIEILGNSRDLIGFEKAGILRKNKIAIVSEKNLPRSLKYIIKKDRVRLKLINKDWFYKKYNNSWAFISKEFHCLNLPIPKVSLIDTATALAALSESKCFINKNVVKHCISQISIPGRFQILSYNPKVILDVAHNFHATTYLSKQLIDIKGFSRIYAIVGILKNKDIKNVFLPLISVVDYWYCITLQTNRSVSAEIIVQYLPIGSSIICSSTKHAWNKIQNIVSTRDIIIAFGSFFTVYEMYKMLKFK